MTGIIVAFPKQEDAISVKNILVRNGYEVAAVCTSGTHVLAAADGYNDGIVVCGYKITDMTYGELRENLSMDFEMLVLASPARLDMSISEGVVNVPMPLKVYDFIGAVNLLSETISEKRRKKRGTLRKRNPEEQKIMDDAKALLMDRNNMTETEAHRYIQKISMDSGTNMVETAQKLLHLYQSDKS